MLSGSVKVLTQLSFEVKIGWDTAQFTHNTRTQNEINKNGIFLLRQTIT